MKIMQVNSDEKLTETFKALSHPLRQDIIFILAGGYQDGIGFTALQRELNQTYKGKKIQVGTIYHHVKLLGDLIDQSKASKWKLSEKGWFAYNLLISSQDRNEFLGQGNSKKNSRLSFIFGILAPPRLFEFVKNSPVLFFGWHFLFFLLFSLITAESNMVLFFVFFDYLPEKNVFLSLISIWISWIAFSILTIISSKRILRRKKVARQDVITIMIFLGLAMLPLSLFPIFKYLSILSVEQKGASLVFVILLQFWVILLVARGISIQFKVRMERAGIVALTSIYVMVIIGIVFS